MTFCSGRLLFGSLEAGETASHRNQKGRFVLKEMSASDVGSGGALCALSGLPLEAEGSREGGWLYREVSTSASGAAGSMAWEVPWPHSARQVFAKSPVDVLDDALHAALDGGAGDVKSQSADQAGQAQNHSETQIGPCATGESGLAAAGHVCASQRYAIPPRQPKGARWATS